MLATGGAGAAPQSAQGSKQRPARSAAGAGRDAVPRRASGGRVLAGSPRSCRRGPQDCLLGHRTGLSLWPPASSLPAAPPADLWGAAYSERPTPSASSACRVEDAGGRGRTGCVWTFPNLRTSLRSFPVDTSALRSEPPTVAPSSPSASPPVSLASQSLRPGLAAGSAPPARTRAAKSAPPRPPRGASAQGETRRPGARKGDTRCLPRNS